MEKLLSIVIPVYKVEKYIDKCISSLLVPDKQQLQLLDIVVINDGTPDNSAILAKAYEKQYPGIVRVIDQENRGHGGFLPDSARRALSCTFVHPYFYLSC